MAPHTPPLQVGYGVSFMSYTKHNDCDILKVHGTSVSYIVKLSCASVFSYFISKYPVQTLMVLYVDYL